jgi:hypothetical protein
MNSPIIEIHHVFAGLYLPAAPIVRTSRVYLRNRSDRQSEPFRGQVESPVRVHRWHVVFGAIVRQASLSAGFLSSMACAGLTCVVHFMNYSFFCTGGGPLSAFHERHTVTAISLDYPANALRVKSDKRLPESSAIYDRKLLGKCAATRLNMSEARGRNPSGASLAITLSPAEAR